VLFAFVEELMLGLTIHFIMIKVRTEVCEHHV
jgi:hypothetical protein